MRIQLSATDVLAPTTMKDAAKCDTSCELQNLASHQTFERTLRFRDTPGSMFVGVSVQPHHHLNPVKGGEVGGRLLVFAPLLTLLEKAGASSDVCSAWSRKCSLPVDVTSLSNETTLRPMR